MAICDLIRLPLLQAGAYLPLQCSLSQRPAVAASQRADAPTAWVHWPNTDRASAMHPGSHPLLLVARSRRAGSGRRAMRHRRHACRSCCICRAPKLLGTGSWDSKLRIYLYLSLRDGLLAIGDHRIHGRISFRRNPSRHERRERNQSEQRQQDGVLRPFRVMKWPSGGNVLQQTEQVEGGSWRRRDTRGRSRSSPSAGGGGC